MELVYPTAKKSLVYPRGALLVVQPSHGISLLTGHETKMQNKIAHLNMVLNLLDIVNRSDLSAKRWAISFTAVFIALGTQQQGFHVAYLAILPMVLLWFIDAQNYRREYLLKKLYDRVRALPEEEIDFSIDIEALPEARQGSLRWMFSSTAFTFYGAMIAGVVIVDAFVL